MKKIILLFTIFLISLNAHAQFGEKVYYKSPVYIEVGAGYQSYKSRDTTLSSIYFPISIMVPLTNELSFTIMNNPYLVTRKLNSADVKVNHLSDTKLNLRYIFPGKNALINMYANIPSGKTKLELNEFDVLTDLSLGILRYKVNTLGEGFNIGAGFTYAIPIGKNNTIGFGISYNNRMEYEPINFEPIEKGREFKYDPADELGINASYFSHLKDDLSLSADAYFVFYSKSKINSEEIFEPGSMTSIILTLFFEPDVWQHTLYLNGRLYGDNKQKEMNLWTTKNNSFQVDADYRILRNLIGNVDVFGLAQVKYYSEYHDNWNGIVYSIEESSMLSLGAGLKIPIQPVNFIVSCKYNTGKLKMDNELDLSGLDISVKINYAF